MNLIMIEEKIIEGNESINIFLGIDSNEFYKTHSALIAQTKGNYHKSWDWLIPAVEKIEHTMYVNIKGCHVTISSIVNVSKSTKIEAVWIAAIEFIKWYNQNKNDPRKNNKIL